MTRTIVITGADGFIGTHFVKNFAAKGFEVYALTIPNSPVVDRIINIDHVHVLQVDLADWKNFINKLPQKPVALINIAWAGVSPEYRNSIDVQAKNVWLCLDAVHIAAEIHAERFILLGSTMEYAYCGQLINNMARPAPQNAYGAAKVAARYLCESLCEELGVSYIYVVISGIYAAERKDNNVIYYTISTLLNGKKPSLTKLEQLWDYVHIDDVVEAFYLIATKGKNGAFYAVGHGDNWPLANYIYMIRDLINPSLPLGIGDIPYKDLRLPSSCVDLTSLREDTGFEPKIPFDIGIRSVIDAIKKDLEEG